MHRQSLATARPDAESLLIVDGSQTGRTAEWAIATWERMWDNGFVRHHWVGPLIRRSAGIAPGGDERDTAQRAVVRPGDMRKGVAMAKYLVLFSFAGETSKRFVAQPSDRAAVVRGLVESAGGSMESYYWMFGQYDGLVIFELPDAQTAAALSLAVTGSGAFNRFETHELIEARDLAEIAERAKQISYQPPGT